MKKLLLTVAGCLFLAGCGGGEDDIVAAHNKAERERAASRLAGATITRAVSTSYRSLVLVLDNGDTVVITSPKWSLDVEFAGTGEGTPCDD